MGNSANSNDIEYNPYTSNSAADAFFYDANERVLAGYAMNKIQLQNLMILAGVPFALVGFVLFAIFYKKFQAKY